MALSACSKGSWTLNGSGSADSGKGGAPAKPLKLIGDGSTADTGAQPHQPTATRMKAGTKPPQFVVFSWDGAGELSNQLFSRFRKVAADHGAKMTFFLSGIYTLPEAKKDLYRPPQHAVGASAIGYLSDRHIHATIQEVRAAWLEGHEIGTHFTGTSAAATVCATGPPPSGAARSTRPWTSSPSGRPTPASPTWSRCPSTTARS